MSQESILFEILSDGNPHRVDELISKVYGCWGPASARLAARINDVKERHGVEINSWPDPENSKLWFYQITERTNNNGQRELVLGGSYGTEADKERERHSRHSREVGMCDMSTAV